MTSEEKAGDTEKYHGFTRHRRTSPPQEVVLWIGAGRGKGRRGEGQEGEEDRGKGRKEGHEPHTD